MRHDSENCKLYFDFVSVGEHKRKILLPGVRGLQETKFPGRSPARSIEKNDLARYKSLNFSFMQMMRDCEYNCTNFKH